MVKAVVWDIGNVFAIWEPEAYYDGLIGRGRREALFAEVPLHDMNMRADMGESLRDITYALAEDHPKWSAEIRRWNDDWVETFRKPVMGTAELFHEVKATGIRCIALSNFGGETIDLARDLHPVLNHFDEEYISAHLGCVKPDPAIYAALEEGTGLKGSDLIFADDKPENIAAATARGWKGHLFEDAAGWRARLVEEGILTA